MRILLVKCSSFNREVPQYSYPLALMYIAAYLRSRNPGHEIEILDLRCSRDPFATLRERLYTFRPDVVGASALTCEAESMHAVAETTKASNPGTTVVVGGPHISACADDVMADQHIDVWAIGEGEETFCELIQVLEDGGDLQSISGIGCRDGGGTYIGQPREPIFDLDALPFPAWDLVDVDVYARLGRAGNLKRGRFLPLYTSRGCPYQCYYCHNLFGKRFRARSADNVIEEVQLIQERYGVRDLEVYDDIFNLDLDRAKSICRGLIELDFDVTLAFPNGVRADRLDRELVELLAEAGTTNLAVAVETASSRLQRKIGKNLALDRVHEAISWADNEGIITNGYFMLGFPTETKEEIRRTIAYAENTDLHFASFFIVTPYPGTPLWSEVMEDAGAATLDFRAYNYLSGYFNLSDLSSKELRTLQREAYRRFYTRKAFKILFSLPRLRIDWWNAAWLWWRRMLDRGTLRR
jgi:anaerobic magnesium-protoporphyrin IX monomethyl ester cyclase